MYVCVILVSKKNKNFILNTKTSTREFDIRCQVGLHSYIQIILVKVEVKYVFLNKQYMNTALCLKLFKTNTWIK